MPEWLKTTVVTVGLIGGWITVLYLLGIIYLCAGLGPKGHLIESGKPKGADE